ncbi:protein C-mannosyl-transferase DPY19L1-like [Montipora foliosa]|uniref:protein C-mannosyl-transferase DPY19L1-like n=1 Tax=Montipora foliosa TaxID=591990 RepID=UPI0035F207C3
MTTKKKKQAASQQVQKSDSRTNPSKSSVRNDFSKTKHGAKVDSLVPVTKYGLGYAFVVLILAAAFGIFHSYHVSRMFENERFFSHLSALERELSFRTEMGLYYSYYKTIVEAPTFVDGVYAIMHCNVTEYPDTINTLKRFNLYPEVVLGFAFRMYDWLTTSMDIHTKTCYTVNRGYNLPPVQSCEGMGELSFFYVYAIFYLSGLMMSMFFLLCFYLSGSILGGLLGTLSYFYNHGESTRVMWTPPLRESFSYPFLVFQLLAVTLTIKSLKADWRHSSLVAATTSFFMIPWQFAQFALLTQTCALFGLYFLQFITSQKLCVILGGLLVGHVLNFIIQFGNSMLLSSFFLSALMTTLIIAKLEPYIYQLPHQLLVWATQGVLFVVGTVGIKFATAKMLGIADDAHIASILRSKFTNFRNFDTSLYTCAPEFDFLDQETPGKLTKTLVLPAAVVSMSTVIMKVLRNEWKTWNTSKRMPTKAKLSDSESDVDERKDYRTEVNLKPFAEHFYHVLQSLAFVAMAVIIMRLKLFGTPALCVMASLLASRQLFSSVCDKKKHQAAVIMLIAAMSVQGLVNLKGQFATQGEYNNPEQEELVEWINAKTPKSSVFAGAMPTMATVKLCTGRAIVNHPHYEDVGIRERTHKVYQIFSRKPPAVVWETLNSMQVTHVVIDTQWCRGRPKPGCGMVDIWDLEDKENRKRPSCCHALEKDARPFKMVFNNEKYYVFQLH